jgi:hypothetical protein
MKRIFVFLLLVLTGCSSSKITHSWKSSNAEIKSNQKILVLGLIHDNDRNMQEKMEQHLVTDLFELGYIASSALKEYGPKAFEKMTEQDVLDKIKNSGFDVVLTIVLLDKSRERYYVPGKIYYSPYTMYQRGFWRYYTMMNERIYSPGYYEESTRYFWESNLFDVQFKQLIYSAQTESFDPASAEILGHEYGQIIVKNLLKEKILVSRK